MIPFLDTARDLARRADPNCPQCKGIGWYLRADKAPLTCACILREAMNVQQGRFGDDAPAAADGTILPSP